MPRSKFLTPSSFKDLMSNGRGKGEPGKTAMGIIERLALDMIGVEPVDRDEFVPASCAWGIDHEWEAITAYEDQTFREVRRPVAFRVSRTHPYVGGTMDGLVGSDGGIEIKCPFNSALHLHNLRDGRQLHDEYMHQIQGYLWVFELKWIDFVSFDPRFPSESRLYVERVEPDPDMIKAIKDRCKMAYDMALLLADQLMSKAI